MENWKDIKAFEGLYQVSDLGRVKALPKKVRYKDGRVYSYNEQILTPGPNKRGYLHVNLFYAVGKSKTFDVHRLVADAFIPNPENKREVNHLFGDKADNRAAMLEWTTSKENKQHGFLTGLYKPGNQGRGKMKRQSYAANQ